MACKIDGCEIGGKITRGLCRNHYMRLFRTGDPLGSTRQARPNWSGHFMYGAWAGMVNRCHNPNNSSYGRYGAVGTRVCDRWRTGEDGKSGFQCFLEDVGERPDGMTLDRYPDSSGNYEPGNCRWATITEQRQNISARGDAKMRAAISLGVKRRWSKWRSKNELRPELTPNQQSRLLTLIDGGPIQRPTDGREVKSLESLERLGLAEFVAGAYNVTDKGVDWHVGGRPAKRFSPVHLRALADSLNT